MKTRAIISLAGSVLLLGGALAGGVQGVAFAGSHKQGGDARKAAAEAGKARALLARGKGDDAVKHAERAALAAPESAEFRMLLGQSYLKAGRFTSARDAFGDTLALDAGNGKAALNLALAQIATGDWDAARKTLAAHADTIPVSDRGLAIALAGDPAAAVDLLASASRADAANIKTRQNLALSLALAGRWTEARAVVGLDLAAADADKRIVEWGAFARPKAASDQVASLLGVTAVVDKGRPAALALNVAAPVAVASAAPVEAAPAPAAPAPVEVAAAPAPTTAAPDAAPSLNTGVPAVQFAARQEIVQPLAAKPEAVPAPKAVAKAAPVEAAPRALAAGKFYVQLGAFDNASVAQDAWKRAARQFPRFAGQTPQGATVKAGAGSFYRLSLGGYARGDAVKLCLSYRAAGGRCFVRTGAGDQLAGWVKPGAELASR
ncbi:SPOR domain-containing protein [Sphingomonas populi]|uniref:SPOR domain-containing protein n=1 Tax=Sphingomonas populi TaxID=2484750 RepID=A0A4Q6XTX6_9SPHN|nr:SPOR domain-containing protein [Sphingomonas populi]RZF61062.1 SPOR domain-containing protein [Sphingomonas populi]